MERSFVALGDGRQYGSCNVDARGIRQTSEFWEDQGLSSECGRRWNKIGTEECKLDGGKCL